MSCSSCAYPPPPIVVSNLAAAQAITFGMSLPPTAPIIAANAVFNGLDWDLQSPLLQGQIFASQAISADFTSAAITNWSAGGVIIYLNTTAILLAPTIVANVQIEHPNLAGTWFTIPIAQVGFGTTGSRLILLTPGMDRSLAAAGYPIHAPVALPRTWRLALTFSGTGSMTMSAQYSYVR